MSITVVTDYGAEKTETITLTFDEWCALSDGITMLLAGYSDNGGWIHNKTKFDAARNKIAAKLLGF